MDSLQITRRLDRQTAGYPSHTAIGKSLPKDCRGSARMFPFPWGTIESYRE